jgi:hypothetical protein
MLVVVIGNIIGKVSGDNSITYYVVEKWVIVWEIVGNFEIVIVHSTFGG